MHGRVQTCPDPTLASKEVKYRAMSSAARQAPGVRSVGMAVRFVWVLGLTCMLLAASGQRGEAGDAGQADQEAALRAVQMHQVVPLVTILGKAERQVPGDVIKVKLKREDGRIVYELKVLARKDGRVREITFDARTGALLKMEDD